MSIKYFMHVLSNGMTEWLTNGQIFKFKSIIHENFKYLEYKNPKFDVLYVYLKKKNYQQHLSVY